MPHLFVWRDRIKLQAGYCAPKECSFCKTNLDYVHPNTEWDTDHHCSLCGWKGFRRVKWDLTVPITDPCLPYDYSYQLGLQRFEVSDATITLDELGAHLKRCYSDVYSLDSRRFEEIVCDVLRRHGDVAKITQATRDGGVDIFLFKPGSSAAWCIVECKRYAPHRRVGIEVVDRLAGVQLALDIQHAKLITTSGFSSPALDRAASSLGSKHGFTMDLVGATELLKLLGVYSENIPPLEKLTPNIIKEMIVENQKNIINL